MLPKEQSWAGAPTRLYPKHSQQADTNVRFLFFWRVSWLEDNVLLACEHRGRRSSWVTLLLKPFCLSEPYGDLVGFRQTGSCKLSAVSGACLLSHFFPQEKEEELEINTVRSIVHVLASFEAAHYYRY